jgi:ATP-dependent RNA helicase RhlE
MAADAAAPESTMTAQPSFAALGLVDPLLRALDALGYITPTPIQARAIPAVLEGRDLLASAQTGTGKTAAFALPLLQQLAASGRSQAGAPRCLVLTPTRELASQIEASVRDYSMHLRVRSLVVFGGVNIKRQIESLRRPVDLLVATPGRLLDLLGQQVLTVGQVSTLVLDEADRMLDMGFIQDIRKVLRQLPAQRQNLLFSATFSPAIRTLAAGILARPVEVDVAPRNSTTELVEQQVHLVDKQHKQPLLSHLIRTQAWPQVLVFTRTKHGANRLAERLNKDGIVAAAIHGNKSQAARTKALDAFKQLDVRVLVATDIAARGLDIEQLPQVVNYELPTVPEDYVHRIGRTGRAGSSGRALSLVDPEEMNLLQGVERLIKRSIVRVQSADFIPPAAVAGGDAIDARPARPVQPRQGPRPGGGPRNGSPHAPARSGGRNAGPRSAPPGVKPRNPSSRTRGVSAPDRRP